MSYSPTIQGIIVAGVLSFIVYFALMLKLARIRIEQGSKMEKSYWTTFTLIHIAICVASIIIAKVAFNINISPYLFQIVLLDIILPIVMGISLYVTGLIPY